MALWEDVRTVKGVGEKSKALFNKLGIETLADLLRYFPRNYDRYAEVSGISELKNGETAVIYAAPRERVLLKSFGRKSIAVCTVEDGSGKMELSWFNMPYIRSKVFKGTHYIFRGKVVKKGQFLGMTQPEVLTEAEYRLKKRVLQPIYPLTKGMTGNFLRKCVASVLPELTERADYLPSEIKKKYSLPSLKAAVEEIHFPKSYDTLLEGRRRLVFDEFFLFSLSIARMKREKKKAGRGRVFLRDSQTEELIENLPFRLTGAQKKVWKEIEEDLTSGARMNRLVQGDVGSGKTLIAVLSCLLAVKNGHQASVMVPTEVLARQHYETFQSLLLPFGVTTVLLTGSVKGKERKSILSMIEAKEADIIIGTHALIRDPVRYADLALVITDEQHRFGVKQREKFMKKGEEPHVMVMSATPIPRTLAVILYGDLDISLVDELPAERLPVRNCVVGTEYRETAFRFIKKETDAGHQAYIICPMIETSEENDELSDVLQYTEDLNRFYRGEVRVSHLHGKLKNDEKNAVMSAFSKGEIDVLVSTTVVEVGVNVPNATVMMVENADRFGLASLHQLMGRIGRGSAQSYCIFMSGTNGEEAMKRLSVLKESNDGFKIAEEDLKLRGSGDIFGIRQSGEMYFAIGDILSDASILKEASEAAKSMSDKTEQECYDRGRTFYGNSFIYGEEISTL